MVRAAFIDQRFVDTRFVDTSLDLSETYWKSALFKNIAFPPHLNTDGAHLEDVAFEDCDLRSVDLRHAVLFGKVKVRGVQTRGVQSFRDRVLPEFRKHLLIEVEEAPIRSMSRPRAALAASTMIAVSTAAAVVPPTITPSPVASSSGNPEGPDATPSPESEQSASPVFAPSVIAGGVSRENGEEVGDAEFLKMVQEDLIARGRAAVHGPLPTVPPTFEQQDWYIALSTWEKLILWIYDANLTRWIFALLGSVAAAFGLSLLFKWWILPELQLVGLRLPKSFSEMALGPMMLMLSVVILLAQLPRRAIDSRRRINLLR